MNMYTAINFFSRISCVLLLCAGIVMTSCERENEIETPKLDTLVTASIQNVTYMTAEIIVKLNISSSDLPFCQVVVYYSNNELFNLSEAEKASVTTVDSEQKFTFKLTDLDCNTKYNYCVYVKSGSNEFYTDIANFSTLQHPYLVQADINIASAADLSSSASANCYIVSESGMYKFKAVKGNSSTSVGNVSSAAILWETFGTSTTIYASDLIAGVCYKEGYVAFKTADSFKEGNAVIAAKDPSGKILWSWHIWFTDEPQTQIYPNNSGAMMDRNLGATSATPGDVGAYGLLYQHGRKDPFIGASSYNTDSVAKSTITWPSPIHRETIIDGVEICESLTYPHEHPTTYIYTPRHLPNANYYWNLGYKDWDARSWVNNDTYIYGKHINDPCPAGWRIADKEISNNAGFNTYVYSKLHRGYMSSDTNNSQPVIWYPITPFIDGATGRLIATSSEYGYYFCSLRSCHIWFKSTIKPFVTSDNYYSSNGCPVRCVME